MQLLEITQQQESLYKSFFIQGLQKHKDCFRISEADEANEPFPTKGTNDSFTLACLNDDDSWMGVVSFEREGKNRERLHHKGLLFRMYVAQEFGGLGLGKQLVEAVISRVIQNTNIEQINLTVIASNLNAKKLYEQFGFTSFSVEHNAIKEGNNYYTEEQMVLFLKR